MRRHQLRLRKRITFEEWKDRKDREMKKEREMKIVTEFEGAGERMGEKRVITNSSEIVKRVNDVIRDMQNKEKMNLHHHVVHQDHLSKTSSCKREPSKANDYIIKEPGKLTFREWLHNKTLMEREKIRKEFEEKLLLEKKKKEREEMVNKAYNVWLIRSKYRFLQKYYSHLGEEKIREILLEDLSKLPLISTKDVAVGDDNIHRVLGNLK